MVSENIIVISSNPDLVHILASFLTACINVDNLTLNPLFERLTVQQYLIVLNTVKIMMVIYEKTQQRTKVFYSTLNEKV